MPDEVKLVVEAFVIVALLMVALVAMTLVDEEVPE